MSGGTEQASSSARRGESTPEAALRSTLASMSVSSQPASELAGAADSPTPPAPITPTSATPFRSMQVDNQQLRDPTRPPTPPHPHLHTPPPLPPRDALFALLHTPLTVTLTDGRELTGALTAVDKHTLLLSNVREVRTLSGKVGQNVAAYYPFSRDEQGYSVQGEQQALAQAEMARARDVRAEGGREGVRGEGEELVQGGEERDQDGERGEGGDRGRTYTLEREVASVLVRFEDMLGVTMAEENAADWSRFAGVRLEDGVAVRP